MNTIVYPMSRTIKRGGAATFLCCFEGGQDFFYDFFLGGHEDFFALF